MPDVDVEALALAEGRVRKALEIVARQRGVIERLQIASRPFGHQADLLSLYEGNLAIFEQHLAFLRGPRPTPAPAG